MSPVLKATLFRSGDSQAVAIPAEFALPGSTVTISRVGQGLLIEPAERGGLVDWLATLEPLDEDIPDIDDRLPEPFEL